MTTSMRSLSPLARCSSHDLIRTQQSPPRSNSFVLSRRCGVVSEQDALRLAATFDDDRRVGDPRQPPRTPTTQTAPSPWPAPVLRQRSNDRRPRPLSTGYLPSNITETQAQQRVQGQGSPAVKAETLDTQPQLQNVALLHNRHLIQQPADGRRRQWNNSPQRKGRPFGDVSPLTTLENGWIPTTRSSGVNDHGSRPSEQQLLAEREAELRAIRSTMEKNEAAILQVMDDQRRAWEADVAAERESWERRLVDAERQIDDDRRTLTERIHDLERENAALQLSNIDDGQYNRDDSSARPRRTGVSDEQLVSVRRQRPDDETSDGRGSFKQLSVNGIEGRPHASWNFTRGSITSTGRTASARCAAEQRRPPPTELNGESAGPDAAASRLPAIPEGPVTRCQHCEATTGELERVKHDFDAERQQWLAEKRRVIAYQKLLQSKYIHLEQRCAELEGSTATDKLKCMENVDGIITPGSCYANGHALRPAWHLQQAQSSPSSLLPRLIPFGQSIET